MKNVSFPSELSQYEKNGVLCLEGTPAEVLALARKSVKYVLKESRRRRKIANIYKFLPEVILVFWGLCITFWLGISGDFRVAWFYTALVPLYPYLAKIRNVKCRYRFVFPKLSYADLWETLGEIENLQQNVTLKLYKSFYEKRLKHLFFLKGKERRIFLVMKYIAPDKEFRYSFKVKKWKLIASETTYVLYYKISVRYKFFLEISVTRILEENGVQKKLFYKVRSKDYFPGYSMD